MFNLLQPLGLRREQGFASKEATAGRVRPSCAQGQEPVWRGRGRVKAPSISLGSLGALKTARLGSSWPFPGGRTSLRLRVGQHHQCHRVPRTQPPWGPWEAPVGCGFK